MYANWVRGDLWHLLLYLSRPVAEMKAWLDSALWLDCVCPIRVWCKDRVRICTCNFSIAHSVGTLSALYTQFTMFTKTLYSQWCNLTTDIICSQILKKYKSSLHMNKLEFLMQIYFTCLQSLNYNYRLYFVNITLFAHYLFDPNLSP